MDKVGISMDQVTQIIVFVFTIVSSVVGIIYKINSSNKKIQDKIEDAINGISSQIYDLREKVVKIEVESKHVRDDHDNLIMLSVHVKDAKHDINNQFGKIRDIETSVNSFIQSFGRKTNG